MKMKSKRRIQGISLVEILLALSVLCFLLGALVGVMTQGARASADAEAFTELLDQAHQKRGEDPAKGRWEALSSDGQRGIALELRESRAGVSYAPRLSTRPAEGRGPG